MNCKIFHAELWGERKYKYQVLNESSFDDIDWKEINPVSPFYLFVPQNIDLFAEYNQGWKITDIFPVNCVSIVTARDTLTIQWTKEEVKKIINDFVNLPEEEARNKYNLGKDVQDWKVSLAQEDIRKSGLKDELIVPILYRPFDIRFTYYTGRYRGFLCRSRNKVMRNMLLGENLGLVATRQQSLSGNWHLIGVTNCLIESSYISNKTAEINSLFPLYIYPNTENQQTNLFVEKTPNLSPNFLKELKGKLGYLPDYESIFYYIYAVFHSSTYRRRYAEFLKIDFPRLPLTSDDNLFKTLAIKGKELVELHLMKSLPSLHGRGTKGEGFFITKYQEGENSQVTQVKYDRQNQRIYFNKQSYFEGISEEVWEFKIGGYQVLDKWLKDRKNAKRELTFEELIHYQKIVIILAETIKIMAEIEGIIPNFPLT